MYNRKFMQFVENLAFILNMNWQDTMKSRIFNSDNHNNRNNKTDRGVRYNCKYEKKAPPLNEQSAAVQQSVFDNREFLSQTNKNFNHFQRIWTYSHIDARNNTEWKSRKCKYITILLNHNYCRDLITMQLNISNILYYPLTHQMKYDSNYMYGSIFPSNSQASLHNDNNNRTNNNNNIITGTMITYEKMKLIINLQRWFVSRTVTMLRLIL